ncbi:MAG: 1-acyl-sn-glycerol-3-phosphate acyltransferase [Myxococcales bacterium]|nr:1-acyl-sn-glycerol-3-phosphate acyltransferase [Myxococcales bacterium]
MLLRRWARRGLMIGTYAVAWAMIQALSPLLVLGLGLHDLVRRNRAASLRLLGLLWLFLLAELWGVTMAGLIWLRHRLTPGRDHDRFLEDNYRLQRWWAQLLLRAAGRLLRLRFSVEGDDQAVPGPVVVLMRHTSIVDTILPVVFLGARHGLRLRYVLKRELLLDPCLDIVGNRLPNYFVDRGGETEREVAAVGQLAEGLGPRDGALIYPEGTRYSRRKLERARAKLAERDPLLHELSAGLRRVLPPRPGGALALLEHALPQGADVVFFAHAGLERLVRLHDVLSGAVLGAHVRLWLWRIPGSEVPTQREARLRWLYAQWARVDALAAETEREPEPSQAEPSPAKPSPAKPSPAKPSPAQPSQAQPSQAQPSQAQPSQPPHP